MKYYLKNIKRMIYFPFSAFIQKNKFIIYYFKDEAGIIVSIISSYIKQYILLIKKFIMLIFFFGAKFIFIFHSHYNIRFSRILKYLSFVYYTLNWIFSFYNIYLFFIFEGSNILPKTWFISVIYNNKFNIWYKLINIIL